MCCIFCFLLRGIILNIWEFLSLAFQKLYHFVLFYTAWLLDSLFNDICVVFVGFGPTENVLMAIKAAAGAEAIGAPVSNVAAAEVIGIPVGVTQGSVAPVATSKTLKCER